MGTKHPMSLSSSCPIKLCLSHHPFVLSCATTDLVSTPSPMQTKHFPLVPTPILTNHIPPTSSFYQPPTLCVNVKPQPYTFPNPLDHTHVGPFFNATLPTLPFAHDQTPQLTLISSTRLQLPPKVFCSTYWRQFTSQRLAHYQHSCQTPNSSNPNPHDHVDSIPSLVPTSPTLA
jgi:hypothetical protein